MTKAKQSAGVLLYRKNTAEKHEVLLAHPGGPFWANKDIGSWTIPKGEFEENDDALEAAIREFEEETGTKLSGDFFPLEPIKQKSGKVIYAWAIKGDLDAEKITSNLFEIEWPPRSGKLKEFPEIDRAAWFGIEEAKLKIIPGQLRFIEELLSICPE